MIPLPHQPKIILEEEGKGVYEIEGLYPGYGQTLGNAMRRVLLSSLVGSAITSVRIEGVNHEFTTVPNVLEDVIEITLNLKQIHFRMHDDGPVTATLHIKGEKKVTAKDIQISSQLETMNPEQHIATIADKKGELAMEFTIEKGLGYQSVETRSREKVPVGTIALDAAFSPVRLVHYEVENMRVGDRTDYNRLRLHIETDGSLTPREAFRQAAKILADQFNALFGVFAEQETESESREGKMTNAGEESEGADKEMSYEEIVAKKKVDEMEFSTRVLNALNNAGIKTAGQLAKKSEKKLKEIEGLGDKGITEVKKALGNLGLTLKQ